MRYIKLKTRAYKKKHYNLKVQAIKMELCQPYFLSASVFVYVLMTRH